MGLKRILTLSLLMVTPALVSFGQEPAPAPAPAAPAAEASPAASGDYRIGAGDQILIRVSNEAELSEKQFRIDPGGILNAPMIGRVQAAGLTSAQLEKEINNRLAVYLQQPDAAVSVTEFQSQPVSVFGEVTTPGVHQLQGQKTLIEMLALAGGIRPGAGPTVKITRQLQYGQIPLPGAQDDATGKFSVAQLELKPLMAGQIPDKDIVIMPNDIISVPRADLIYVAGDVTRSGPLTLTDRPTMSILEALSATGGVMKTADTKKARILRIVPGNSVRENVPVNIAKIMSGQANDMQLMAGDILVVPSSNTKKAAQRALDTAIQLGTVIVSGGILSGAL
ncbi:MAG TPA: polysaccharide biosynthesis/export family protein [Bryobacteraceae bacterium]|nr:polysaccharide biosynthesis/export family protein [Bryobacteraceae bacterium]